MKPRHPGALAFDKDSLTGEQHFEIL